MEANFETILSGGLWVADNIRLELQPDSRVCGELVQEGLGGNADPERRSVPPTDLDNVSYY